MTFFKELKGNLWIGMNILEIISFPDIEYFDENKREDVIKKVYSNCKKIIEEFYRLSKLQCTSAELMWVTDKISGQTFKSNIRIFLLLRQYGNNKQEIDTVLSLLQKNFILSISAMHFQLDEIVSFANFKYILDSISSECTLAICKDGKCVGNQNSIFPYYYSEIIAGDNMDNYGSIVLSMGQMSNCCISYQIFPTAWTAEEKYYLNEMAIKLTDISNGININGRFYKDLSAKDPAIVFSYYNSRSNMPLYRYNILINGKRKDCANLANKVIGTLQSGNHKYINAEFRTIDLSNGIVDIKNDILFYPWNINNRMLVTYKNMFMKHNMTAVPALLHMPYNMTCEEVVSFFRLPVREEGMNALKSNSINQTGDYFDEEVVAKDNIRLGSLITNEISSINIGCSLNTFTKHTLIVGTPGSGKTTFAFNLLSQFYKHGIPFLAIEPTKSEYRALIDIIPDIQIFTPGNSGVAPFVINPFIPPKGVRIEQYIPSLASAFKAAFSMPSPLDVIFMRAIRTCYLEYGWKDYSMLGDPDVKKFGLYEFILIFKQIVNESNYGKDVKGNLESGGVFRLLNLIEQNSNIYDTINTVPIEDILEKASIIELNAIENTEQKALIMALLLISICVYTKNNNINDGRLKNIILIDEAHVLLGDKGYLDGDKPNTQGTTIKALQDMIAEIRSLGTGIIIADQSPLKVSREVVAQTELKIAFRLVHQAEKEVIRDSTNMDEIQAQKLSKLKVGQAYVYYSKLDVPQLILTEDVRENDKIRLYVENAEIQRRMTYWDDKKSLLKPYAECEFCRYCKEKCDFYIRANAEYYASRLCTLCKKNITDSNKFIQYIWEIKNLVGNIEGSFDDIQKKRLIECIRIKFTRKIQLEKNLRIKNYVLREIMESIEEK